MAGPRRIQGPGVPPQPMGQPIGNTYTVKKGDTLAQIAKNLGISLEDLLKANPQIQDPHKIKPGQTIQIPSKRSVASQSGQRQPSKSQVQYEKAPEPSIFDKLLKKAISWFANPEPTVTSPTETKPQQISPDVSKIQQWIAEGNYDLSKPSTINDLTDRLFYERHPDLKGKPLNSKTVSDPKQLKKLQEEWKEIQNTIVKPCVGQVICEKYGITQKDIADWQAQVPVLVALEQTYSADRLAYAVLAKKLGYNSWGEVAEAVKKDNQLRQVWEHVRNSIKPNVGQVLASDMKRLGLKSMVRGIENTSPAFLQKVAQVAKELGIDPDYLMAAMSFETGGTFKADIQNKSTKATGLIQFLPSTAKDLGTTVEELAKMTPEQQLDYVKKYFEDRKKERGDLKTIDDVYLAILHPAGIGKGRDDVLFKSGTKEYDLNKGLDADGDGQITVGEATARVRQIYEMGLLPETKPQESSPTVTPPTSGNR